MKFLVLRFSSIGDIVLTTPVVRCLKKKYPEAEIHYATKKSFQTIVQHNPYISRVHLLNDSVFDLVKALKQEKFDYVIDLHHNQRTLLIKTLLGVKSFSFDKINFEKWLMVNFKINRLPKVHIVDRYLATCKTLGVENDGGGLDYFIPKEDEIDAPALFHKGVNGANAGYIAWVIGAKQNTKQFPVGKIIHALNKIEVPVLLLGGKEDIDKAQQIISATTHNMVFNACGKYTLNESASLVRQAKLIVSNDTGLMHIAAALKKPIISIWGNTIPEFGMSPYYGWENETAVNSNKAAQLFQVAGLSCRPCSKLGYAQCPKGHFKCMNEINEAEIVRVLNTMYAD